MQCKKELIWGNSFHTQPKTHVRCSGTEYYSDAISNVNYCLYKKKKRKKKKAQAFITASNCVYVYIVINTCVYILHTCINI